jgi:E3 ubiquitin-protein ligase UHRF1
LKDADAGDDSDDDFDAGEHDEDSDDEEYEGRKKCRSTLPKGPRPKVVIPKNRPNVYGAIPGVEVGRMWATRMECCADGIHRPTVAGIHAGPEGAYSIALSGGYEDDVDLGDCFTYTGN